MTEELENNLKDLIEAFINTNEKHNQILEMQTDSLLNNTINKDCKSKIYERLKEVDNKVQDLYTRLSFLEDKTTKCETYLEGDGKYSKGLILDIANMNKNIIEITDFIKNLKNTIHTTKNNFNWLYNFFSGAGGAILMIIFQRLVK